MSCSVLCVSVRVCQSVLRSFFTVKVQCVPALMFVSIPRCTVFDIHILVLRHICCRMVAFTVQPRLILLNTLRL